MRTLRLMTIAILLPLGLGGCVVAADVTPGYGYYSDARPYAYAPPPRAYYYRPPPRPYHYGYGPRRPHYYGY